MQIKTIIGLFRLLDFYSVYNPSTYARHYYQYLSSRKHKLTNTFEKIPIHCKYLKQKRVATFPISLRDEILCFFDDVSLR